MTNKIAKRGLVESNEVREVAYGVVANLEIPEHFAVGKTEEGFNFVNADGNAVVVKVIVKALGYNAVEEVEAHASEQAIKVKQAEAKKALKEAKLAKKIVVAE